MVVFLVMVVVVPQLDALAFRFGVMPLDFGLEMRMLSGLAVLVSRNGVLVIAALVAELPSLLLGHSSVLVVFAMVRVAMVVAGGRV